MQDATTRNVARDIESDILCRIAARGVTNVAKAVGVDKAQISRWQSSGGMVGKAALLLAALDYRTPEGMVIFQGEETADLAKELIKMLEHIRTPKNKTSAATEAI